MNRTLIVAVAVAFSFGAASAGTIKLAWDPTPGASGYQIYYGTSPGNYSNVVDVGNTTQTTLTGIADCVDYYVAAKAYNGSGESAQFSSELAGWAAPRVTSNATLNATQGDQFTLDVTGFNFRSGAQLQVDTSDIPTDQGGTPLVRVDNPSILDCNNAQALVTVEPTAGGRAMEVGTFDFDVSVTNPSGVLGVRNTNLVVAYDVVRTDLNRSDTMTADRIDGKDLAWLAFAHGAAEGDARWNADADLNGDGFVDGLDLALLAVGFGGCWNGSGWSGSACP